MKIKKQALIASLLALVFGVGIIGVSIFRICHNQVLAEVNKVMEKQGVDVFRNGDEKKLIERKVDYYLAYPGILPDHPLYWLKMIRDRILLSLAKKPIQKAERLLLYADKRIGAAQMLVDKKKIQLGVTTATKAEKYLERAVLQSRTLKDEELRNRLHKAILKHKEVLQQIKEKTPIGFNSVIEQIEQKQEELKRTDF